MFFSLVGNARLNIVERHKRKSSNVDAANLSRRLCFTLVKIENPCSKQQNVENCEAVDIRC